MTRRKEGRKRFTITLHDNEVIELDNLAAQFGITHNNLPNISGLIQAIANKQITLSRNSDNGVE